MFKFTDLSAQEFADRYLSKKPYFRSATFNFDCIENHSGLVEVKHDCKVSVESYDFENLSVDNDQTICDESITSESDCTYVFENDSGHDVLAMLAIYNWDTD